MFPRPDADGGALEVAKVADAEGLDLVGIQDHPYQRRFLDTFTLLGWIAASTRRVRVFPDVACLPLRSPAMLAKQAATIDSLSGGRFELGLGAGGFWDAIHAMGGPRRSPAEALEALEEAISILRRWWAGERGIRHHGRHYRLDGVHGGPPPAHRIEIWLGVYGTRAVELCGRAADGWIPSLPMTDLETLGRRQALLDRAAREAGRDPGSIRRMLNVAGEITGSSSRGFLEGPADQWVDQLAELAVDHGFDTFVLWPRDTDPVGQTARFAAVAQELRRVVGGDQPNSIP
ncbi:MAG: N5,N10-methylene tetrahydromethanopterin reductase [Acidimicrobiia bacterium]|nr:MAG: N5,N10-methylene tetrahydromethanopterin reductase [Acidimicrobiia bacterium]